MRVTDRRGAAAAALLFLALVGIILMGLLLDAGQLAVQQTRLEHATEAAARAAFAACGGDPACAAATAARYVQANLPGAAVDSVSLGPPVTVQTSLPVPYAFSQLWHAEPATLHAQYILGHQ